MQYVQQGWPAQVPAESPLKPYFNRKDELSSMDGCLLCGARVVVPKQYRALVMDQLHEGHPGATNVCLAA